jgi:O-antigen ligase
LPGGERWLRVYGTLAHPNLLGGMTLSLLALVLTLYLVRSRRWLIYFFVFIAGLALLVLTFSRSSWGGLIVLLALLLLQAKRLDRKRLVLLLVACLLGVGLLFTALNPLVATRLGFRQVETERVSTYTRSWLMQRTWEIMRQNPLLGVGAGSFTVALYEHVAPFNRIEPVHNTPFLIWSELGIVGLVIEAGLILVILVTSLKARQPVAIILSAGLIGLLAVSLFDHYLWTIAPGRVLLATMLGLWAGQVYDEHRS